MAYYLAAGSDVTREYVSIPPLTLSGDFIIEMDFSFDGSQNWRPMGRIEDFTSRFFKAAGSNEFRVSADLSQTITMSGVVYEQRNVYRLERSGQTISLIINGDPQGVVNDAGQFDFTSLFTQNSEFQSRGDSQLYRLRVWGDTTETNLLRDYDPSASNGTGSILPDTVGGNDGTLVNFPNDDSQWVFYDDGQGGGDTLVPTLIPSGEVVGTPSVTNLLQLVEANAIPTQEVVQNPVIDTGAILISPATIPTGEVVYNVSVVDLTQFIAAEDIPTQEVVGSPSLELLLSRIFPTAIATQENFETPLIIGGDRIAIPVNDRATWNRVAAYLRTRKFSGNDNDVILAWLRSEGYIDTFNDAFNTYLEDVEALDGSLTDKYSNWRRQ